MTRRKRRTYTDQQRAEAVKIWQQSGKTIAEVARDLDLTATSLRQWANQEEIDARGPANTSRPSSSALALSRPLVGRRSDVSLGSRLQYSAKRVRDALGSAGITCSMSRRGNCWDNAVDEAYLAMLKREHV